MHSRVFQMFDAPEQMLEQHELDKVLLLALRQREVLEVFDHVVNQPTKLQFSEQKLSIAHFLNRRARPRVSIR